MCCNSLKLSSGRTLGRGGVHDFGHCLKRSFVIREFSYGVPDFFTVKCWGPFLRVRILLPLKKQTKNNSNTGIMRLTFGHGKHLACFLIGLNVTFLILSIYWFLDPPYRLIGLKIQKIFSQRIIKILLGSQYYIFVN